MHLASWIEFVWLAYLFKNTYASPAAASGKPKPYPGNAPPNILFIITDDQDAQMGSLDYMPYLQKELLAKGTHYRKHYCTITVCCPSRVSLWTGKAAHNTNVTDVTLPYGGYPKFISQGLNENWFPVWLKDAGYNMYYSGKLMNQHNVQNYNDPYPAGFAGTRFFLDPYTYLYFNPIIQKNQQPPKLHTGEYSTDLLTNQTLEMLDEGVASGKPFFVAAAPIGPHSLTKISTAGASFGPPLPAPRHRGLFNNEQVPRGPSFNPDTPSGANWIKALPKQNATQLAYNDNFYRQRLRALQSVDDMVETLMERLKHHGVFDNTYIIYTTDNGYHIGQHRLPPGKTCGYEEDINIPLIIRGPGVLEGKVTDIVTTHTDLAPTMLSLLNIPQRPDFDGAIIPTDGSGLGAAESSRTRQEHVNVEFWGTPSAEGIYTYDDLLANYINTYKAARVIGHDYSFYYSVWCNNEHELYDMTADPYQMRNLYTKKASNKQILGRPLKTVIARLDTLLFVLKSCKGGTCIEPWKALHPKGNVNNLMDALDPAYDDFYQTQQPRVKYDHCEVGYLIDSEGPQFPKDGSVFHKKHHGYWPHMT